MADIRCPMCGKPNPAGAEFCQHCQARLAPLHGAGSSGSSSEAESDWLSGLRSPDDQDPAAGSGETDWWSDEDESAGDGAETGDLPDWLSAVRPAAQGDEDPHQPGDPSSLPEDETDWLHRIRSRQQEEAAQPTQSEGDAPTHSGEPAPADFDAEYEQFIREQKARLEQSPSGEDLSSSDDLRAWLAGLDREDASAASEPPTAPAGQTEPDWLAGAASWPSGDEELPAWMQQPGDAAPEMDEPPAAEPEISGQPDLPEADAQLPAAFGQPPVPDAQPAAAGGPASPGEADDLDWLTPAADEAQPGATDDLDWLTPTAEEAQPGATDDLDWLAPAAQGGQPDEAPPAAAFGETVPEDDLDWLAPAAGSAEDGSAEDGSAEDGSAEDGGAHTGETPPSAAAEAPGEAFDLDWLRTEAMTGEAGDISEGAARSFAEAGEAPAFQGEADEALGDLAAADLPEWLSQASLPPAAAGGPAGSAGAGSAAGSGAGVPPAGPGSEPSSDLARANLPGWLESIRPLPEANPEEPSGEEGRPESAGPLSGLRGLLPAEPLISLVQKPPVYLSKLQISEAQQANANLLTELVEAEGAQPAARQRRSRSSIYLLRLLSALVLSGVVLWSILFGGTTSPLPVFTEGTNQARSLIEALPQAEPVLLVSDYQPGAAAELEAAAAPVIDHLLLKGAHLALVSTTPTGALQAERLVAAGAVSGSHRIQTGEQYTQLGFLPGGALGISAFVANPAQALPLNDQGDFAWQQGPLVGLGSVQDFGLIVVAADDSEAARAWIEQLALARGSVPLLVIASAQAGPQIRPYLQQAGGVDGMVTGLAGGAAYETWLGRSGLAGRSWSAFSLALLAAAVLILAGALIQGAAGQWPVRQPTNRGGEKS